VAWLIKIQKELRVSAPELVLATIVLHSATAGCALVPFAWKLGGNCGRKLNELNLFGGENSQEEWSLIVFFNWVSLNIGHNDIVDRLVFVGWTERQSAGDFSLLEALQALGCLQFNVVLVNFPETISLGSDSHNQEVDWNVLIVAEGGVFLH
jgi:hypothetical protein